MVGDTGPDRMKRRAQALFSKAKLDDDKAAAVREWQKAAAAEAAKTARLRALRLAKEAADAEAAKAAAEAKAARPRRPKPTTAPSGR